MLQERKYFDINGFNIIKNCCPIEVIDIINNSIKTKLQKCYTELNSSIGDYLRSVSRWMHPSPITENIYDMIVPLLKDKVSNFIGTEVVLAKMNIISKSAYADNPVPCHQDISYSREKPYQFSLWLALQNVDISDGVLEFLPKSHLGKIFPAIDFWQVNYSDQMYLSNDWQQNSIAVPVQSGDAIAFDSRIWHRSAKNTSGSNRFALVTRWSSIGYQPPKEIPEKSPANFGMWNCGKISEDLLQQGLKKWFQYDISADLITYIHLWQEKLSQRVKIPFEINLHNAQNVLKDLLILHQASEKHNGGDSQGTVYANLWKHFLFPLSKGFM